MKAILFVLAVLTLVPAARAEVDANVLIGTEQPCGGRLGEIVKHSKVKLPINDSVYKLAKSALQHYRDTLTQGGVYIASAVAYKDALHGTTAGYSVYITDGGDESLVVYYFDAKKKLIYGKWHNQSPETYWFCEK